MQEVKLNPTQVHALTLSTIKDLQAGLQNHFLVVSQCDRNQHVQVQDQCQPLHKYAKCLHPLLASRINLYLCIPGPNLVAHKETLDKTFN